jgi:hypothetical protein
MPKPIVIGSADLAMPAERTQTANIAAAATRQCLGLTIAASLIPFVLPLDLSRLVTRCPE